MIKDKKVAVFTCWLVMERFGGFWSRGYWLFEVFDGNGFFEENGPVSEVDLTGKSWN